MRGLLLVALPRFFEIGSSGQSPGELGEEGGEAGRAHGRYAEDGVEGRAHGLFLP